MKGTKMVPNPPNESPVRKAGILNFPGNNQSKQDSVLNWLSSQDEPSPTGTSSNGLSANKQEAADGQSDLERLSQEQNRTESPYFQRSEASKEKLRNECVFCEKIFRYPYELRDHQLLHTGEKPFGCSKCDKRFRKKGQVKQHEDIHNKVKLYDCQLCSKTFALEKYVKRHEAKVHQLKSQTHTCSWCGLDLDGILQLHTHDLSHTTNRQDGPNKPRMVPPPHVSASKQINPGGFPLPELFPNTKISLQCLLCPFSTEETEDMRIHQRIHSSQTFSCSFCPETFAEAEDRNAHESCHLKQKRDGPENPKGENPGNNSIAAPTISNDSGIVSITQYADTHASSSFENQEWSMDNQEEMSPDGFEETPVNKKQGMTSESKFQKSRKNSNVQIPENFESFLEETSKCGYAFNDDQLPKLSPNIPGQNCRANHSSIFEDPLQLDPETPIGRSYNCTLCPKFFQQITSLEYHLNWHRRNSNLSNVQGQSFRSKLVTQTLDSESSPIHFRCTPASKRKRKFEDSPSPKATSADWGLKPKASETVQASIELKINPKILDEKSDPVGEESFAGSVTARGRIRTRSMTSANENVEVPCNKNMRQCKACGESWSNDKALAQHYVAAHDLPRVALTRCHVTFSGLP